MSEACRKIDGGWNRDASASFDSESDRAALVKLGGPVVRCMSRDTVCGDPRPGWTTSGCSDQFRPRQRRLARGPLPVGAAREIRASLTMIQGTAWQMKATMERNGSG